MEIKETLARPWDVNAIVPCLGWNKMKRQTRVRFFEWFSNTEAKSRHWLLKLDIEKIINNDVLLFPTLNCTETEAWWADPKLLLGENFKKKRKRDDGWNEILSRCKKDLEVEISKWWEFCLRKRCKNRKTTMEYYYMQRH